MCTQTCLFYVETKAEGGDYHIVHQAHQRVPIPYPFFVIKRYDFCRLKCFQEVFVHYCNMASVCFCLMQRDGTTFFCRPTREGLLRVEYVEQNGSEFVEDFARRHALDSQRLQSSDLALSTWTFMYDYITTSLGTYLVGLSLMPFGALYIPHRINNKELARWRSCWTHFMCSPTTKGYVFIRGGGIGRGGETCSFSTLERPDQVKKL